MAKATICDKCGKTFDYVNTTKEKGFLVCKEVTVEKTFEFTGHSFGFGQHRDLKSFDLCPKCIDEVVEFVSGNKLTERTCVPFDAEANLSGTDCPAWICSECSQLFEAGAKYCSNCGARVVGRE